MKFCSLAIAAVVVVLGACGGQVSGSADAGDDAHASSSGSSSGGTSNSSGSSGGSVVPVDLCPPDPPTAGVTCVSPGQGCAYRVAGECEGYRCTSGGSWQVDPTVTCP